MYKVQSVRLSSKMLNLIGLAILVFSTFAAGSIGVAYAQEPLAGDYYYYANGNRIELTPSLNWMSVKFASDDPAAQSAALKNSGAMLGTLDQARQIPRPALTLLPLKESLTKQMINSLRANTASFLQVNPVFQTADAEMAVTDEFIVTFPAGTSMEEIDAINSSYGAEMVEPILGQENTFILRVANTQLDVLSMANLYQESGVAIYSAPNFVRIIKASPSESQTRQTVGPMAGTNDTLYTDQWYLNNTQQYGSWMTYDADIDAPEAWDHTTGSSAITIAVIDEGVDLTHEDYSSKLVAGYDATGGGSSGGPWGNDSHGTNVAGIAAASSNNSLGVAGVCQNCRIMPVRIAYGDGAGHWVTTDATLANGITWAYQNGADVLNNSWGGGLEATVINTAISNAKTLGRGGKGAVIVISAGNDNLSSVGYPAYLSDVIAVGASNMCDQRKTPSANDCNKEDWWGSNYGSALDISAPGVWLDSTDIMGAAGSTTGNYNYYFNGTSGAAPIVSGVAGLVLSVNPNLTANEVQTILQSTADDVNGGGWDTEMGYGRVNADAAVQAAATGSSTFTDVPTTYWAWSYIERLYNAGITGGCSTSPLMYCPLSPVTRAQMAIFILRGEHGSGYTPPPVKVKEVAAETLAGALVSLSADKASFGAAEDVILHVTITNPNDYSIRMLKWLTPAEGVEGPLFTVTRDGEAVAYLGKLVKRAAPTDKDYITLAAGESLTRDVDLSTFYDLSVSGNYAVEYNVASADLYAKEDGKQFDNADRLASNMVELFVAGRANRVLQEVSPQVVTGTTNFVGCSASQQTDLVNARNAASTYAADAVSYFAASKQGARYTTWFGVYDASRYSTVSSHFSSLQYAMDNANPMTFDCSTCTNPSWYAYVYPDSPYNIYLCGAFWSAPTTGTDSKAGTLIHETTHFTAVVGTDDYAYGQAAAQALAISNPSQAIMNADSHEYFAENNPPLETSSGTFIDVPSTYWAAAWIEQFALEGITSGCGGGMYCPDANVTRAQMAIFLLKGKYGSSYIPPAATGIFSDVPVGSFAADWIEQLYAEGITSGCGGGMYCPNSDVLRDQMAVFLVRAFGLP